MYLFHFFFFLIKWKIVVQARVTSRASTIQNCVAEQAGGQLTSCGLCEKGKILSKDKLKCLS